MSAENNNKIETYVNNQVCLGERDELKGMLTGDGRFVIVRVMDEEETLLSPGVYLVEDWDDDVLFGRKVSSNSDWGFLFFEDTLLEKITIYDWRSDSRSRAVVDSIVEVLKAVERTAHGYQFIAMDERISLIWW